MNLRSQRELEVTLRKLTLLEKQYEKTAQKAVDDPLVRQLTLRSLRRTINRFKEEIARYRAGAGVAKEESGGPKA